MEEKRTELEAGDGRVRRVLAISSGGGHWMQLMRIRPALAGCAVTYATVEPSYRERVPRARFHTFADASRWNKLGLLRMAAKILWIVVRERPEVVVTTGAAPGYFALRFAKLLGARTLWLDSMANADALSLSGQRARPHADLWLTQWPHLAQAGGPHYRGEVL